MQPIKVNGEHILITSPGFGNLKSTILILNALRGIWRKKEERNKDLLGIVDVFVIVLYVQLKTASLHSA